MQFSSACDLWTINCFFSSSKLFFISSNWDKSIEPPISSGAVLNLGAVSKGPSGPSIFLELSSSAIWLFRYLFSLVAIRRLEFRSYNFKTSIRYKLSLFNYFIIRFCISLTFINFIFKLFNSNFALLKEFK